MRDGKSRRWLDSGGLIGYKNASSRGETAFTHTSHLGGKRMRMRLVPVLAASVLVFAILACEARADGVMPRGNQLSDNTRYALDGGSLFAGGDGAPILPELLYEPPEEPAPPEPPPGPPPGQYRRPPGRARGHYKGARAGREKPDRSLRVGWLFVAEADDEEPDNTAVLGISLRFDMPEHPRYRFEISLDKSIGRMRLSTTPLVMDDFYGEYLELVFAVLGRFRPRPGEEESPMYWGVGLGYSKETYRVNYTDAARNNSLDPAPGSDTDFNESAVFQVKIGLETRRNTYIELAFKKRFGAHRTIDQIFIFTVGFYF